MKTSLKTLKINPKKNVRILLITIGILLLGQFMYLFTIFVKGYRLKSLFEFFNFNGEGNFPTLYSVIAILYAAVLLFYVGFMKKDEVKKNNRDWYILSGIFCFLAFDEAAQVHERLNVVRDYVSEDYYGFLFYAWIIPYALAALFIGIYFIRFLKDLPRRTSILFIAAGAIFVTGAAGIEMLNSYYRDETQIQVHLAITVEELMEMLGIVLFIYAILDYIKRNIGQKLTVLIISFESTADSSYNSDQSTDNSKTYPQKKYSKIVPT